MINVALIWTPSFAVGQKHALDHLSRHEMFPALPAVGQKFVVAEWSLGEGSEPKRTGGYITFVVQEVKFYKEHLVLPIEVSVSLALQTKEGDGDEPASSACEVLISVYKWETHN